MGTGLERQKWRENARKHRQNHPEYYRERDKKLRQEHPERKRNWNKISRLRHSHPCPLCGELTQGKTCRNCLNFRGVNNPFWKGGRYYSCGYVRIYNPNHHHANKAGYVYEHILVWEQVTGKSLPPGWLIHHINRVKDDNRIENLIAMPRSEHINEHRKD